MTPQNIINNANDMQYQRNTRNNQPRMTPQQQYQRNTPSNQQRNGRRAGKNKETSINVHNCS